MRALQQLGVAVAETSRAAPERIRLGALISQTDLGDADTQIALRLATDDVNAILAHAGSRTRVELTVAGTGYAPGVAQQALATLARRGIRVVIGPETSAELARVLPSAQRAGVVLVSHGATAPMPALPPGASAIRLLPDDTRQAAALAHIMAGHGVRAVVPLWRADGSGHYLAAALDGHLRPRGGMACPGTGLAPGGQVQASREAVARQLDHVRRGGDPSATAVLFLGFGTDVAVLSQAGQHPELASVPWYGSDGTAQSLELVSDPDAARFAIKTGYTATVFTPAPTCLAAHVRARVRHCLRRDTHACALAAYDGVVLSTLTAMVTPDGPEFPSAFCSAFRILARQYRGATGQIRFDPAGGRDAGTYAAWTVTQTSEGCAWQQTGLNIPPLPDGGVGGTPCPQRPISGL